MNSDFQSSSDGLKQSTPSSSAPARHRPVALVTGASSGIGLATARQLASRGWTVYAASRTIAENLDELQLDSNEQFAIHPLTLDILDDLSCVQAVSLVTSNGPIDALVHCAGAGIAGAVEEIPMDQAIWQFDNLLFGTIRMVRAVLPKMRIQGHGRIILVSSVAAAIPIPFQVYYSAAKAAIHALVLGLADEIRPLRIKVTEISRVIPTPVLQMPGELPHTIMILPIASGWPGRSPAWLMTNGTAWIQI